ncbi:GGDEF domain-containing protein [Pseudodesulfovibrio sp.]|uniref:GGDEF domain-containing protein n=1 Tax=Pseudodesulfovibrio sp. TaxID=2035812 RepID=UPI0026089A69|nr:GGDEF domain-containing protein [Pseudodesulfovibrio sp.]MDD3312055.1 GGDEF domain-containing protein [Pseudodesulfovibrio sp.]
MPKETDTNFPERELASELEMLQQELRQVGGEDNGSSVWVFRLFHGVTPEEWKDICERHDLRSWLSLPIDGDAFPHLKRFQETLERLAYQTDHDPLTGLANRRAFDRVLDVEVERSRRSQTPLSLAIFDLDNFKAVNDTYGHTVGDAVLAGFAEKLRATTRRYDLAARFGGEEFALIMAGTGLVKAQRMLNRFLSEFRMLEFHDPASGKTFSVTCSVGLTCFKGMADITDKELINLADEALYEAKAAGKDQVRISKLPFLDSVPNDTLVQAHEKQFLFGGK